MKVFALSIGSVAREEDINDWNSEMFSPVLLEFVSPYDGVSATVAVITRLVLAIVAIRAVKCSCHHPRRDQTPATQRL